MAVSKDSSRLRWRFPNLPLTVSWRDKQYKQYYKQYKQ